MSLTEDTLSVSSELDFGELRTCECGNYQTRRCSSKGAQRGWKTPKTPRFVLDARSERRARSLTDCCLATPTKKNLSKPSRVVGVGGEYLKPTLSLQLCLLNHPSCLLWSTFPITLYHWFRLFHLDVSLCCALVLSCFMIHVWRPQLPVSLLHHSLSLLPVSVDVKLKTEKKTVSSSSVSCLLSCFVFFPPD